MFKCEIYGTLKNSFTSQPTSAERKAEETEENAGKKAEKNAAFCHRFLKSEHPDLSDSLFYVLYLQQRPHSWADSDALPLCSSLSLKNRFPAASAWLLCMLAHHWRSNLSLALFQTIWHAVCIVFKVQPSVWDVKTSATHGEPWLLIFSQVPLFFSLKAQSLEQLSSNHVTECLCCPKLLYFCIGITCSDRFLTPKN